MRQDKFSGSFLCPLSHLRRLSENCNENCSENWCPRKFFFNLFYFLFLAYNLRIPGYVTVQRLHYLEGICKGKRGALSRIQVPVLSDPAVQLKQNEGICLLNLVIEQALKIREKLIKHSRKTNISQGCCDGRIVLFKDVLEW